MEREGRARGSGGLGGSGGAGGTGPLPDGVTRVVTVGGKRVFLRRRLSNWNERDYAAYRTAVRVMKSRPLLDPTSCVPTAAQAPIFWTHHANIDRFWRRWLDDAAHANPSSGAFLTQVFSFFDETGAPVTMTGADVLDTVAKLDYDHELREAEY